jgi:hypothetical protein
LSRFNLYLNYKNNFKKITINLYNSKIDLYLSLSQLLIKTK